MTCGPGRRGDGDESEVIGGTEGDPRRAAAALLFLSGILGGGGVPAYCARRARRSGVPADGVYEPGIPSPSLRIGIGGLMLSGCEGEDIVKKRSTGESYNLAPSLLN